MYNSKLNSGIDEGVRIHSWKIFEANLPKTKRRFHEKKSDSLRTVLPSCGFVQWKWFWKKKVAQPALWLFSDFLCVLSRAPYLFPLLSFIKDFDFHGLQFLNTGSCLFFLFTFSLVAWTSGFWRLECWRSTKRKTCRKTLQKKIP